MATSVLDLTLDRDQILRELTSADSGVQPDWSPLGLPLITDDGRADHAIGELLKPPVARACSTGADATIASTIEAAISVLSTRFRRDREIMDAIGLQRRRTRPWTGLKPGDFAQLRALLLDVQILSAQDLARLAGHEPAAAFRAVESVGVGLQICDAVPCFIPGGIAEALMTSEAPDDQLVEQLRLPFPSVIVFFDAVPLGVLELGTVLRDGISDNIIDKTDMSLIGLLLASGKGGVGLDPICHWIMTTTLGDIHGVTSQSGFWRHSAQPGVVTNVAALCTWARWHQPVVAPSQLEGEPDSRTFRRSLERSAVRKAINRGAVIGVNVVDLAALHNNHTNDAASPSRAVRAHWRRGYWNSVRIATRDADGAIVGDRLGEPGVDWHYEGRWIHPVLVNGDQPETLTVYRVERHPTA